MSLMTLGLGQVYDSGLDINTSGITVNPNPSVPSGIDINSIPLDSSAGLMLPDVAAIPCQTGQTCSYIANVPDWLLYLGAVAVVLVPLFLTRKR